LFDRDDLSCSTITTGLLGCGLGSPRPWLGRALGNYSGAGMPLVPSTDHAVANAYHEAGLPAVRRGSPARANAAHRQMRLKPLPGRGRIAAGRPRLSLGRRGTEPGVTARRIPTGGRACTRVSDHTPRAIHREYFSWRLGQGYYRVAHSFCIGGPHNTQHFPVWTLTPPLVEEAAWHTAIGPHDCQASRASGGRLCRKGRTGRAPRGDAPPRTQCRSRRDETIRCPRNAPDTVSDRQG